MQRFDIEEAIKKIDKPWTPVNLVTFDDRVLQLVLFDGEYKEHTHDYDEFFYVYRGKITIWTEKGNIELSEGQGGVVEKGIKHKPMAENPSYVLMVDLVS